MRELRFRAFVKDENKIFEVAGIDFTFEIDATRRRSF